MTKFSSEDIQSLYQKEAAKHGSEGTSTIQDIRTRQLEIDALLKYIKSGRYVLEVGCGNGYVADQICRRVEIKLEAFDYSQDLISIAKERSPQGWKGTAKFFHGNVLTYKPSTSVDLVFTERCLQNLTTWEEQKAALNRIADWLEPGGSFVMLESFWEGLNNLNEARGELGLEPIPESWHNNFFRESEVIATCDGYGLSLVGRDCFLSGYYFGSRVLLPALLPDPAKANFKSRLNDYFCALPPAGDFSPMKILQFVRR